MTHVTILVDYVPEGVLMGILEDVVTLLANLGIMVETVPCLVCQTVRLVDTQMVRVRVGQVGWGIIAQ